MRLILILTMTAIASMAQDETRLAQQAAILAQQEAFQAVQETAQAAGEDARDQALRAAKERTGEQSRLMAVQTAERAREMTARTLARTDREDANYRRGTSAIDRRDYDGAIVAFDRAIEAKIARADGALYWKAYAQNRLGRRDQALASLAQLQKEFPQSRWTSDAKALEVEVRQAAGRPVSPDAEADDGDAPSGAEGERGGRDVGQDGPPLRAADEQPFSGAPRLDSGPFLRHGAPPSAPSEAAFEDITMVSSTQQFERIRKRKKTTQGKRNKRDLRRNGTPAFPVHPVGYDAKAADAKPAK